MDSNAIQMKVLPHSKMRNLLGYAINKMKQDDIKQMVWFGKAGCGKRALHCADIMKRKVKNLCKLTRHGVHRVEEYWEPTSIAGLDRLKVTKSTEVAATLLSKTSLEEYSHEPGYLGAKDIPPYEDRSMPKHHRKIQSKDSSNPATNSKQASRSVAYPSRDRQFNSNR